MKESCKEFGWRRNVTLFLSLVLLIHNVSGQDLASGFSKAEYLQLLKIAASQGDTLQPGPNYLTPPEDYTRIYRSDEVGLKNRWDLWIDDEEQKLVISIRGTINDGVSWLENFYSTMVPATGELILDSQTTFTYRLAKDPKATVHAGWTLGLAYMAPSIVEQLSEQYNQHGIKSVYIMGHSQGGALAFLLTSYLHYLMEDGELPSDLVLKTYCSAAPKPGNLFYAYDYDYVTRGGWSFTVVNAADWVPETPFSLQTISDFNDLNPFKNIEKGLKMQQPFYVRWYLKHAFNKMDGSTKKAQRNFHKYLGATLFKQVKKVLPTLEEPKYAASMNYMRAGIPIVLQPDSTYFKLYPEGDHNFFVHHGLKAYADLLERCY